MDLHRVKILNISIAYALACIVYTQPRLTPKRRADAGAKYVLHSSESDTKVHTDIGLSSIIRT